MGARLTRVIPFGFSCVRSYTCLLVVNITKIMRNASGSHSWLNLKSVLRDAAHNAYDPGRTKEMTILNKVICLGQRMMGMSNNPYHALATWTQLIPNVRDIDQKKLKDVKALQRIWTACGVSSGPRGGGALTLPFPTVQVLATERRLPYWGGGHPMRGAYTPPAIGAAAFAMAAAAPAAVHPLQGAQGKGRSKSRTGKQATQGHGQTGNVPAKSVSHQELAINTENKRTQDLHQGFRRSRQVTRAPCDSCGSKQRNPNHHHLLCLFTVCRKCKRGGAPR